MSRDPGGGLRHRALRRIELERSFGLEEVLLPPAPATPAAPAEKPAPPSPTRRTGSRAGEESPVAKSPESRRTRKRRAGPAGPASSPEPASAPAAPPAKPEEERIVINSEAHRTGDLFGGNEDEFGERVPDAHRRGLPAAEALELLKDWALECRRCPLSGTRTNVVFGEGSPEAKLVFVGEAPGADEDATGRPFVGRAGQLLDKIVRAMGLEREEVFICNILKCRPPGNRTPGPREVAACSPLLREQLKVLEAKVIVALGGPSAKTLLESNLGITRLRGRFHVYNGVPLMPTFHPAYLLRNPGEQYKRMVWEDMKAVLARLGIEPPARGSGSR